LHKPLVSVKSSKSNNYKWELLPLAIADQQRHIELSMNLLNSIQPGDPAVLYWSIAQSEGVVLGFSQKQDVLNQAVMEKTHIPIYHRRAGGTAVLVGSCLLSLDVVLPKDHPLILPDIVKSYQWLGEAWVETLRQFGVAARTVSPEEAHAQRDLLNRNATAQTEALFRRACYGALSPFEVVSGQRKVVGLDMIRRQKGSLLQAGVLLQWKTEQLAALLAHTPEEQSLLRSGLKDRAVGLDELTGRSIAPEVIIAAFEDVLLEK
jgi:lipoate-protein ligase A